MSIWSESVYENDVECIFSNDCEIYHMTDLETGEYDAKLDVYPDHVEYYSSEDSFWVEHDHTHMDSDGNVTVCHGMEERPWEDKDRG